MTFFKIFCLLFAFLFSFSAQADETPFFASVFTTVYNKHITPIELEDFVVSGLKKISKIDKNFTFSNGSDMVYLYHRGKIIAMSRKPQDKNDINAWAGIANSILKKAKNYSKIIARSTSFAAERIVSYSVAALRDHSIYHFSNEPAEPAENTIFAGLTDEDILYIRINNFNSGTAETINEKYQKTNAQSIILDLRGNPGGQISEAITVAKLFIDDGIILSTRSRSQDNEKYYISDKKPIINLPLAVIIDRNTASSAEILAAALHEQAQAVLIGTSTFGKGSYQETYIFENGGKLSLTVGEFYTPSGKNIDRKGLSPDYCIINDIPYKTENCPRQPRENRLFDIDFAVKLLLSEISS